MRQSLFHGTTLCKFFASWLLQNGTRCFQLADLCVHVSSRESRGFSASGQQKSESETFSGSPLQLDEHPCMRDQ